MKDTLFNFFSSNGVLVSWAIVEMSQLKTSLKVILGHRQWDDFERMMQLCWNFVFDYSFITQYNCKISFS